MPFVRASRDTRGYEHYYLVHTPTRRGRPTRARVLYWFRSPPGVRVGREPFDEEVRQALEAQYPGVVFDWSTLSDVKVPPPDSESWRERRRAERAARDARNAEEPEASSAPADADQSASFEAQASAEGVAEGDTPPIENGVAERELSPDQGVSLPRERARRRRRRGGGRGQRPSNGPTAPSDAPDSGVPPPRSEPDDA